MFFFVLLLLAARVSGRAGYGGLVHDKAAVLAELAAAPAAPGSGAPIQAVHRALAKAKAAMTRFQRDSRHSQLNRDRAAQALVWLNSRVVVRASRDAVALAGRSRTTSSPVLEIAFRGTQITRRTAASDVVQDARIAVNADRVERLDQALAFVRQVITAFPSIARHRGRGMILTGHSLGGFIAEGVGSHYPQAQVVTVNAFSPFLTTGNHRPAAFAPRKSSRQYRPPIRFVTKGDIVSMRTSNLARPDAKLIKTQPRKDLDPLTNHYVGNEIPWSPDNKQRRRKRL